jgi:HAD superfamily hydrolase (TIGR01549 family)
MGERWMKRAKSLSIAPNDKITMGPWFPEQLNAVIFDCDGVLIDSREAHVIFFNQVKESLGLDPMSADEEDFVFMGATDEALRYIIPPGSLDEAKRLAEHIDFNSTLPYLDLEPGIVELLMALQEMGIPAAVNTNRGAEVAFIFEAFALMDFFRIVVTADDVAAPKPNPEGLKKIISVLGVGPHETVFIGDSIVDEKTARSVGATFWAYKNPSLSAHLYVSDFWNLRKKIQAMERAVVH